jgi:hypothetical protein
MAYLGKLPDDPDGQFMALPGVRHGLTAIEIVGHEMGHHWLMAVDYDLGQGSQTLLRGHDDDGPNLHYSARVDTRSVMYGSCIQDHEDGTFTQCGCGDRKYNSLDQYLMGLRPPAEVDPLFLVDDGSGQGDPSIPLEAGKCLDPIAGTRVDVEVDDVIRAMGPRTEPDPKSCWRVGFVLVTAGGIPALDSEITKWDTYRVRFESWFSWATDDRGRLVTTLEPGTACPAVDREEPANDADGGGLDGGDSQSGDEHNGGGCGCSGSGDPNSCLLILIFVVFLLARLRFPS